MKIQSGYSLTVRCKFFKISIKNPSTFEWADRRPVFIFLVHSIVFGQLSKFFQGVANHLNVRYEPLFLNVQLFKCNVVLNQNFDDTNLKKLKNIINSVLHPFACVIMH